MKAVHGIVAGRVQGVGFRYSTQRTAARLNLTGWVRNRPNGTVEVFAQGDDGAIDDFTTWLHVGPPGANVTSAMIDRAEMDRTCRQFEVRY